MPGPRLTSTGKLSELARHVVLPSGVTSTGWPAVRDRCASFRVSFDGWQDGLGRAILAKRDNGLYAAGIGGVVISICRQVGKTFTVGAMIVALCLLHPGLKVVWTAHRGRTSDETFKTLQGFAKRKGVAEFVASVRVANGQQEIEFLNGSRILFGAREAGFGRGFDDVDVLVFDEAQILTSKALDDMVPATNVSPNPLILMMGTPPKPTDPSEAFTSRRTEALAGDSDDLLYVEFSADRLASVDDRAQWRRGNPSFPHRTPEAAMLRMRKQLGEDSFKREGLGIWDEVTRGSVVAGPAWAGRAVNDPPEGRWRAFALDMSPDRLWVSVGVAARPEVGPVHLECVFHEPADRRMPDGVSATQEAVEFLVERRSAAVPVLVAAQSTAMSLVPELKRRNVDVTVLSEPEFSRACGLFVDGVRDASVTHFDQGPLNLAVSSAGKREVGAAGAWVWDRRVVGVDLTPLVAVTAALYGVMGTRRAPGGGGRSVPRERRSSSGRVAYVSS